MRFVSIIIAGMIATYCLVAAGIWGTQRLLIYHPNTHYLTPQAMTNLPLGVSEEKLKTEDGETIIAWYLPAAPGKRTILFFPGNAGHLPFMPDRFRLANKMGFGLMAVAYRGYSGSTGTPTEGGLTIDARTAYDWLAAKVEAQSIIIHGAALGAAVATRLASEKPARELVLEAPYTAVVDVLARRFWFLPIPYMIEDKFLTRELIGTVKMPVLVVYGELDEVVPKAAAEAVFALAPEPKSFKLIPKGSHNNLSELGLYEAILEFAETAR